MYAKILNGLHKAHLSKLAVVLAALMEATPANPKSKAATAGRHYLQKIRPSKPCSYCGKDAPYPDSTHFSCKDGFLQQQY